MLRIDTLQRVIDLVLAMITAQSVNHRDLGPHLPGTSSPEAKKRRVERAVHDEQLTAQVFLALVLVHLPPGKILMSLDRTTWEHGNAPAAAFVRIADGMRTAPGAHLPGEEVWIPGEEWVAGEKKYYACNLPPGTTLITLVEIMKRRWACEHAHRDLLQEVGLSHFEGRSWRGLCHHAALCLLALGFLQWLRLTQPDEVFGVTVPAIREELAGAWPRPVICPRCRRVVAAHPAGP